MKTWKLVTSAALVAGVASAAEPARIQDPPGEIAVDQPAGVSIHDRNTARDTTDTLQGGGRTDVIAGKRAARRPSGPTVVRPTLSRSTVEQGAPARAALGGTGSSGTAVTGSRPDASPSEVGGGGSTSLGTDLGYGTGTESQPVTPSR